MVEHIKCIDHELINHKLLLMKFSVETTDPLTQTADLLVIGYHDKQKKGSLFEKVDLKLKKELGKILKKEGFKGHIGEVKLLFTHGKLKSDYVLVLGLGEEKNFKLENFRNAGATSLNVAKQIKAKKVRAEILGQTLRQETSEACAQAFAEGFILNNYQFTKYTKKTPSVLAQLVFHTQKNQLKKIQNAANLVQTVARGVYLARDLINTPGADMTPLELARVAKSLKGVQTKVHDLNAIKKLKMGAFLSVAHGSTSNPPCFIEMHYKPHGKAQKKIAIIGKGVTFDSGGYSLKPPKSMETMKDDMSGAAAVLGLMSVIQIIQPNVEVSCYIAATENMIDGSAQRPGDICRAMNGKTIEVLNTDAEGRLTLADALTYATQKKPDYVIDMATLTGACLVALGLRYSAIMGNDQELMDELIETAKDTGEYLWQLPLAEEYKDELKSPIADLKNVGGNYAGSITAGLFLQEFVGKTKWAHLDIAGPAWTDAPLAYIPRGGAGIMVRTLVKFLLGF